MSNSEIISSILNLSLQDRKKIIELIIQTIHQSDEEKLEKAADLMLVDYKQDKELTIFTMR